MHVPKSVSKKHEFRTNKGVYCIDIGTLCPLSRCLSTILSCRARIFYPGQSQVDDSGHDPPPPNKKRKMAHTELSASTLVNSTEESSIASVHHKTTIL